MTLQMKKVAVECRNIRLAYDRTEVLKDVNLRIEPGEFFALLGPSGSGKSTLLRLIAGFVRHRHGELLVDGRDISSVPPHARNIGMVFQSYALWPHLSVQDTVTFGLVERRVPRPEIRRRVEQALQTVGLGDFAQRRPGQLSGGQQQRVALARTIVIEPQVLLLDEPLSNLDKNLRVQMRQELLALQRRLGITTIFVTHDQEEAMTTADRMAVLDQGVVQQVGTPTRLYDTPVNRFVATFVGTTNLIDVTVRARDGARLRVDAVGVGELWLQAPEPGPPGGTPVGAQLVAGFRPQAVRLRPAGEPSGGSGGGSDGTSAEQGMPWFDGTVESGEFLGESTRYRIRVGEQFLIVDQPHRSGGTRLPTGSRVRVGLDPDAVRLLPP